MRILITGGSGYLGQFLLLSLSNGQHELGYTYLKRALPSDTCAKAFQADLSSGKGLEEAVLGFRPQVVINCAALSQPAACEHDYEACRALNRPSQLVEALCRLEQQHAVTALLIHLSTDQVGSRKLLLPVRAG